MRTQSWKPLKTRAKVKRMHFKIKPQERLICEFCKMPFYPAPQVRDPRTCGRPECLNVLRRLYKATRKISAFLLSDYHKVLDTLDSMGLRKSWFLIYTIGETGILVSELIRLRPCDMDFKGPEKKIRVRPSIHAAGGRGAYHRISGAVAGNLERWSEENGLKAQDRIFPYTKRSAQKMFKRAMNVSGISGKWGTRSLRHMYGLTVAMATDSADAVRKAMRTRGKKSAEIYVKTARDIMGKGV